MKKIGKQTIKFDTPPTILETACIAGPKEADGPLAKYFDKWDNMKKQPGAYFHMGYPPMYFFYNIGYVS